MAEKTSLYNLQSRNVFRTWILMTTFLIIVILLGWLFSWYFNSVFILYIAVLLSVGTNIYAYYNSDKTALRLTGAKPAKRSEYFDLYNSLENLSIRVGTPMPALYIIEDDVPNAFATGRSPSHSAVVVSTGLLSLLDKNELEGVISHELAHIVNRDTLVMTVTVILIGLIAILADIGLRMFVFGGSKRSSGGPIAVIAIIAVIVLAPITASLIRLAISRKREYLADASGAIFTRYPEGLASALEKIDAYSKDRTMKKANHATAHLFIHNPFSDKREAKSKLAHLFSTHPPTDKRISALRSMDA